MPQIGRRPMHLLTCEGRDHAASLQGYPAHLALEHKRSTNK